MRHTLRLKLTAGGTSLANRVELDGKSIACSAIELRRTVDGATEVKLTIPAVTLDDAELEVDDLNLVIQLQVPTL